MRVDNPPASKVLADHRAKLAYVYVRQSSPGQMLHHGESTQLQYALTQRAVALGWPKDRVHIIDEDLGKSGATSDERRGFQFLMAEIGLARVGLVISFDASRLARNNSLWYQLIELCSIFGTLIADDEQLYDPRLYHDRLLLGLSGMMSEAELHHIRARMHAAQRQKAERGELRLPLPVGLDRHRDGSVMLTPDEEVQARLHLIFAKFAELGSTTAVRDFLQAEKLLIPSRPMRGPAPHEIVWRGAGRSAILAILQNPAYAGAYVYGRTISDPTRRTPGNARSGTRGVPIDRWAVCLQDHYPAYVSWEVFVANQARITANANCFARGAPGQARNGRALLQGIVLCGRCGRRMALSYSGPKGTYPVYRCAADRHEYGDPRCQEVRGLGLEEEVVRLVLAALEPERLVLALEALEQIELEQAALERQWRLRLERARYEATRAERQYNAVDPENRLVARSLERQWEEKLRGVEGVEREYETWRGDHQAEITAEDRQQILALGENLPAIWEAETTTNADRKQLLRLIVTEVIVDQHRARGKVWLQINWQTGASTQHWMVRTVLGYHLHAHAEELERRVRELTERKMVDAEIAAVLDAEGYRTTRGRQIKRASVWHMRHLWGIASVTQAGAEANPARWADGSYTIRGVAETVGVRTGTVFEWLRRGRIHGTQVAKGMPWKIPLTDDEIESLREHVRRARRPRRATSHLDHRSEAETQVLGEKDENELISTEIECAESAATARIGSS